MGEKIQNSEHFRHFDLYVKLGRGLFLVHLTVRGVVEVFLPFCHNGSLLVKNASLIT